MQPFAIIVLTVGAGLLLLGCFSAYALFSRAVRASERSADDANMATLWGLFMLGTTSGLALIWLALP